MTDYMVTGLVATRAELAGEVERTHERLRSVVNDLASIDATLRIVAPDRQHKGAHLPASAPIVGRAEGFWGVSPPPPY